MRSDKEEIMSAITGKFVPISCLQIRASFPSETIYVFISTEETKYNHNIKLVRTELQYNDVCYYFLWAHYEGG